MKFMFKNPSKIWKPGYEKLTLLEGLVPENERDNYSNFNKENLVLNELILKIP